MIAIAGKRVTAADAGLLTLIAATAYWMKRFFSTASAEQLHFALAPTAALVEAVTGIPFAQERGAGFVSASRHIVIAPACSGMNYMIIALLSLTVVHLPSIGAAARKAAFVLGAALIAYPAMIVVNAVRISAGIFVGHYLASCSAAVREQAHCAVGVVVYLSSLSLLGDGARHVVRRVAG